MGSSEPDMQPLSWLARLVLGLAQERIGAFRFFWSNHAVAVGVDALEIFPATKEFAARDHAVAVAIHLAEPERAPGRRRRSTIDGGTLVGRRGSRDQKITRLCLRQQKIKLTRDIFASHVACGTFGPRRQHRRGGLQFALPQAAVMVD